MEYSFVFKSEVIAKNDTLTASIYNLLVMKQSTIISILLAN